MPADQPEPPFAVAFPGQGVDPVDLGRILTEHDRDPLVDALAERLSTRAWTELDITDTRIAQPCVYVASVLQATGRVTPTDAAAVFGHSMGELSAMAFAGVFSPLDGLDLMIRRADIGHAANERRGGAMAVVMKLDEPQMEWVRRRAVAEAGGVLDLAVVNGPGQYVFSGDAATVDHVIELINDLEGVGRRLPIGGAYHSPLMLDAVDPYRAAIDSLDLRDPVVPVVSSTTQATVTTAGDVVDVLTRALVLPVRWVETMHAVLALGITRAVDAGPGSTLANLARFSPVLELTTLSPQKSRRR